MISQQKFPKGFLWGASTSAHQVEGGTVNQWTAWELETAADRAVAAGEKLSWLPDYEDLKVQIADPNNYISGKGVDHYNRYIEDFDLAKKLQMNSLRFGIEWARINPSEGVWDKEAIAHYHRYIDELHARGIEPIMNIWHWTMPTWFVEKGGFEKKENLVFFDQLVERVAEEYADKITYVLTLNEPNVYTSFSYLAGEWPPLKKSFWTSYTVYRNLVQAHHRAYKILKARRSTLQIGIAMQLGNIQAKRPHNVFDGIATKAMRFGWNWWFLNQCRKYQDFIGINYYFTDYYQGMSFKAPDSAHKQGNDVQMPVIQRFNPSVPLSDLGWYMEPEGLYPVIIRTWARYKKPIIITENGVADRNDQYRQWWLEETMIAMQRAISEGVDLRGYMHWGLLDNFEWAFGWWPQFGLIAVDRANGMTRKPRQSAIWYARYIRSLQDGVKTVKPAAKPADPEVVPQAAEPATQAAETETEMSATVEAVVPQVTPLPQPRRRPLARMAPARPTIQNLKPKRPAQTAPDANKPALLSRLKPVKRGPTRIGGRGRSL